MSTQELHERLESRALVQGMLVGLLQRYLGEEDLMILVKDVEQERDTHGNYLPYFTITMGSGARLKVSVDVVG